MASTPASISADVVRSRLEGSLGAGGFARTIGDNGPIVRAVGDAEIPGGGFAEMLLQKGERFRFQIRARLDPEPLHPCRGDGSDPVEPGDRQGCDEVPAHVGSDDELAVRLALTGRELGEELVVGDARRGCQTRLLEDAAREFPWR